MIPLDLKRMKVLLIDDEQFIRTTIRQILVQIGIPQANVYEADSSDIGLSETLRTRPDIVLCDIHMPAGGGFAYLAKIRKSSLADVAATPVVMLTSDATKYAVETAKGLKVDGFLVKPVSVTAVKRALEWALKPVEAASGESELEGLFIEGDPADLRMISALLKELYNVKITKRLLNA
ncbi:MAG: response regulator [Rhodospirillales bacterium]|nr:response regulator [Rhodospirillales bacterium]